MLRSHKNKFFFVGWLGPFSMILFLLGVGISNDRAQNSSMDIGSMYTTLHLPILRTVGGVILWREGIIITYDHTFHSSNIKALKCM